jgi:hypothetical protein
MLVFPISFLWVRCQSQKTDSVEALLSYAVNSENGLVQSTDRDGTTMSLMYQPRDIAVAGNLRGRSTINSEDVDSARKSIEEYDYFVLHLSKDDQEILNQYVNTPSFSDAVNYLSFGIRKDFRLVHGQDTVGLFDLMHTRTYGASHHTSLLLAFKSNLEHASEDCVVLFDDTFFGTGLQKFPFQISAIQHIPLLDYKTLTK